MKTNYQLQAWWDGKWHVIGSVKLDPARHNLPAIALRHPVKQPGTPRARSLKTR